MVFTVLSGGLGNQMFQYAFGYILAKNQKSRFVLDISELKRDNKRQFALSPFHVNEKIIEVKPQKLSRMQRIWNRIPNHIQEIFEKKEFGFDSEILNTVGDIRVEGYWQCPKYFNHHKKDLSRIFSLRKPGILFKKLFDEVELSESVSIHVRRGDYVSEALTNNVHGTCSIDFYKASLQIVNDRLKGKLIRYYIFSDDMAWCKEHFAFLENWIPIESMSDAEELILMSHCKHNIIANSSFSWWAAWLNPNTDKIVIAPKVWFNNAKHNTEQLIPETWVRI